jgi:propionyl-CoA carboxylase beta chain
VAVTGTQHLIGDLLLRRDEAIRNAEKRAAERQHPRGALTARERIELLVDAGSFVQIDELAQRRAGDDRPYGDGVVAGHATVDRRRIALYAHDSTVFDGSIGEASAGTIGKVLRLATRIGCPVVGLVDSAGARNSESVAALAAHAALTRSQVRAAGVVPQVSVVLGGCSGEALVSAALADVTVAVAAAGLPHADYLATDEADAIDWTQCLLGYLPGNYLEEPPSYAPEAGGRDPGLDVLLPDDGSSYDMREVITRVVDDADVLPLQERLAPAMICAFARVGGRSVGVVANQPLHSGELDALAARKAARFIRLCDAFGIPVVTFADTAGCTASAWVATAAAELTAAYASATVPLVTVLVGRLAGGGYGLMGAKQLGADVVLAWPTARIAGGGLDAVYAAAERGYVDAVIAPAETRRFVLRALAMLRTKRASA